MPYAGLSVTTRPAEACNKSYNLVKKTLSPFIIQKSWIQPNAQVYVSKLLTEVPQVKEQMNGKLAVVTGVTIGGAGYHAAEELAIQAGMHVILLGRNETKLQATIEAIEKEATKRNIDTKPTLYKTTYDLDSLTSAKSASEYITKIANEKYDGKLHVLLNNAGMVNANPSLTKDGIEANVGRNFVTVYYLTELLLPILKKAATSEYKPRVVDVASISHIFGDDFQPERLVTNPKEGGSPPGRVVENDDGTITYKITSLEGAQFLYGRAKMAVVATTKYMQTKHPELNFTCMHPGSICSNFGSEMGIGGKIYYYGFYIFQYSSSQGAVAELRPCLDPDFNTIKDLQGSYLHADGNPWIPISPQSINPSTGKVYATHVEFGEACAKAADELIQKIMMQ